MTAKWDRRFMELAQLVASWSKDPSTKTGAVVVDTERRVLGVGFNGFPRYVDDDSERYADRMTKYKLVVHAEANCILNADLVGVRRGSVLYATKHPCSECAKLICQVGGIHHVISPMGCDPHSPDESMRRWAEDALFARQMFSESGIIWQEYRP